jgi:hypothetical protein
LYGLAKFLLLLNGLDLEMVDHMVVYNLKFPVDILVVQLVLAELMVEVGYLVESESLFLIVSSRQLVGAVVIALAFTPF